jgi:uncharacterized membrane protein YbaN (DUF454 family)
VLSLAYRVIVLTVGLLLVVLGLIGLFLPFLQGFLLIGLGLSVMSLVSERVAGWVRALRVRARFAWSRLKQRRRARRGADE